MSHWSPLTLAANSPSVYHPDLNTSTERKVSLLPSWHLNFKENIPVIKRQLCPMNVKQQIIANTCRASTTPGDVLDTSYMMLSLYYFYEWGRCYFDSHSFGWKTCPKLRNLFKVTELCSWTESRDLRDTGEKLLTSNPIRINSENTNCSSEAQWLSCTPVLLQRRRRRPICLLLLCPVQLWGPEGHLISCPHSNPAGFPHCQGCRRRKRGAGVLGKARETKRAGSKNTRTNDERNLSWETRNIRW